MCVYVNIMCNLFVKLILSFFTSKDIIFVKFDSLYIIYNYNSIVETYTYNIQAGLIQNKTGLTSKGV